MNPTVTQQCKSVVSLATKLASWAEGCQSMNHLKQIQAQAIASNLQTHSIILGKLFRFAAVSPYGDLAYAYRMFDHMTQPTNFFYNTLIRGYAKSSFPAYSVVLFNQMRQNCIDPDEFSFNFLIKARSRMRLDEISGLPDIMDRDEIHGALLKFGFSSHLLVQNALIHLYAVRGCPVAARAVFDESFRVDIISWSGLVLGHVRAGQLELARQIFDGMPEKDVVSWTAMISGYAQAKYSREALELFSEMGKSGVRPDEVTIVSVISACTRLGDVDLGICVHSYIVQNGFGWMVSLCNALIDMYAKCGCMDRAWQVFNNMSRKSLITWNSMISACANHGEAEGAFWLFSCMLNSGVAPDGITFLSVLIAYTHKGLVDEGYSLFKSMQRDYGIEPSIEHYGCVVDMLGRAGRLNEAYEMVVSMPIPSNDVVWGALLAACRVHGDVDMGERVVKRLLELKPEEGGYYILLRDIYNTSGRTAEANQVRRAMWDSGAEKNPGYSWVGT
ncbi:hypothetical protein K2173_014028 [Erythroxylum novogranatense]|uniref:Pentatricopeptide repeat-containing protein n=1 Tax=Erythroxylum novogranatense TaxID=1862640 RepID=A0AAV8SDH0_9ROSI|nr:hypothetical protein K2173_014028 [Erythroxylum novogranatense]